jgi:hypothetical protein
LVDRHRHGSGICVGERQRMKKSSSFGCEVGIRRIDGLLRLLNFPGVGGRQMDIVYFSPCLSRAEIQRVQGSLIAFPSIQRTSDPPNRPPWHYTNPQQFFSPPPSGGNEHLGLFWKSILCITHESNSVSVPLSCLAPVSQPGCQNTSPFQMSLQGLCLLMPAQPTASRRDECIALCLASLQIEFDADLVPTAFACTLA